MTTITDTTDTTEASELLARLAVLADEIAATDQAGAGLRSDRIVAMRRLRELGVTHRRIAAAAGVSGPAVIQALRRAGFAGPSTRPGVVAGPPAGPCRR
jgi:hypothetical protein